MLAFVDTRVKVYGLKLFFLPILLHCKHEIRKFIYNAREGTFIYIGGIEEMDPVKRAINKQAYSILQEPEIYKRLKSINGRKWYFGGGHQIAFEASRAALMAGASVEDAQLAAIRAVMGESPKPPTSESGPL